MDVEGHGRAWVWRARDGEWCEEDEDVDGKVRAPRVIPACGLVTQVGDEVWIPLATSTPHTMLV